MQMQFTTDTFTEKSLKLLSAAQAVALAKAHPSLHPLHIGAALLDQRDGLLSQLLQRVNANAIAFDAALNRALNKLPAQAPPPTSVTVSRQLEQFVNKCKALQKANGDSHVAVDHMILALLDSAEFAPIISESGVNKSVMENALKSIRGTAKVQDSRAEESYDALNKYGRDLVEAARSGSLDPVIGRDDEIARVIRVLARRTKNNPVLIGPPGVGKTAIVEGLAQRIVRGDVPEILKCRLFSLDVGLLVAGASYAGEFEKRFKDVLREVQEAKGSVILFIDEMHLLLGAGKGGSVNAANLMKPALARGELHCIAATTLDEYREYVEKDPAFERRFQPVTVGEPSVPDTISILRGLKERYEVHHGVRIADNALVFAAQLAHRYIQGRFLPDKAIDLVDEACANARVQLDSRPEVIDVLQRKHLRLEIEATALAKETDNASKTRLEKVKEELGKIDEELAPLLLRHRNELHQIDEQRELKQKLDQLKTKANDAEARHDLTLAADLRYYAIPEVEARLAQLNMKPNRSDRRRSTSAAASGNNSDESDSEDGDNLEGAPSIGSLDSQRLVSDVIAEEQIAAVISRWTGIPLSKLNESESSKLLHFADRLKERVVGQDSAADSVAEAIIRSRSGLAKPHQPIGSFLFLGPTGVGKTEMAKAIATELFDNSESMIRIDMSEYMEKHSVSRLIGAPPGYVGFEAGGQLTEAVRRRPYNVVLMDEVEKAHPDVLNVLLQVMDAGKLTDGQGRIVDFSNVVLVLTSNVGQSFMVGPESTGLTDASKREKVMKAVRQHFRPEFLNRLDDITIFNALQRPQLRQICTMLMRDIEQRLEDRNSGGAGGVSIVLDTAAADAMIEEAYDPLYGARPLRRFLEKKIVTEIGRMVLAGETSLKSQQQILITTSKPNGSGSASLPPAGSKILATHEVGNLKFIVSTTSTKRVRPSNEK